VLREQRASGANGARGASSTSGARHLRAAPRVCAADAAAEPLREIDTVKRIFHFTDSERRR
jgi:hypothetical protein